MVVTLMKREDIENKAGAVLKPESDRRGGTMADDPRKTSVVDILASAIVGSANQEQIKSQLAKDEQGAIAAFLDGSATMLQGKLEGNGIVTCTNVPSYEDSGVASAIVTKLKSGALDSTDIPQNILVSSVSTSPLRSLYANLHNVYAPLINAQVDGLGGNKKLQGLLAELEAGIGSMLRRGSGVLMDSSEKDQLFQEPNEASLLAILSPTDEFQMWAELAATSGVPDNIARRAQQVYQCFEPITRQFEDIKVQGEEAVLELVDVTHDSLEKVWEVNDSRDGFGFGQLRMDHLLRIIGEAFLGYLQVQLEGVNLWSGPFKTVESGLRYGLRLMGRWERVTQDLTTLTWPRHRHNWTGGKFDDKRMTETRHRIDEVLKMREMHQELSKLLSEDEAQTLRLDNVFLPFTHLNPLSTSVYTEPLWKAAKDEYEKHMVPIESRISQKLRELFGSVLIPSLSATVSKHGDRGSAALAEAHQVFNELSRYGELMSRKVIADALATERASLLKQMTSHLDNLRNDFESRSDTRMRGGNAEDNISTTGRNLPDVVDNITWAIQCEQKLTQTDATFTAVGGMSTGSGGEHFDSQCKDLQRDIKEFKKAMFSAWQDSLNDRLMDIKLEKTGKLMDLDSKEGHVKLHYNSELVTLLREVRQLAALGFPIRRDVAAETDTARKFYRHGMVLKQVANFYNDIGTQMIDCQKAMMLDDAREFERVLTNPKDGMGKTVTWNNPVALEGYIHRLQAVANGLTDKNRRLRKTHRVLGEKVSDMLNLDLVRQRDRWGKAIKELREIFTTLEREGFSAESQATWRLHWDFQIYKVLQTQYERGLECLNETLPQMEVKLVFKQKRLQFEPPLEEIRTQHFKQIKGFLNLPLTHKGVSEQSQAAGFFRHMVDKNGANVAKVYERAEMLFARLAEEQKKLTDWVALGTVDLDEFCDQNLDEVADWENNFRMLKLASKDAEKLPTEAKVDCYQVNMMPAKTAVEEQLKRLQESLTNSLKRKAQIEKEEVEAFINEGKGTLEAEATSVEEIGKARAGAKNLVGAISRVMQLRRKVDEKNKLLRSVLGSNAQQGVVDMSALSNEWDNFTTKLQQHESHLDEQKNQLKVQVDKRVADFSTKLDSFASRWHELKPKGIPQGDPQLVISKIEDDYRIYEELKEEMEKIRSDCEHFSMDVPDMLAIEEVGQDIENTRSSWSRFSDFMGERKEIGQRDWISFRKTIYNLEDFLAKWSESVKGTASKDSVGVLLLEEIDKNRKCVPLLKFVRGEGWERNHWAQLFSLLGFPTKGPDAITVENLTVDHFLEKADKLVEKGEEIKHLHSQAQGEVTLREALHQLKVWGLERSFTLVSHESSGKHPVVLIKEWKEIMTEVGDHQALVSSLKDSPFFGPFKEETSVWETRLANLSESCIHLNAVQRKWVYLEPIFARGALPQEQPRFRRVDDEFRQIMVAVQSDPLVVSFSDMPRLAQQLPQMSSQLDICQRALSEFLEEKRGIFPRFYFIGDDDLLEILGQAKNPVVIQTHLKKLFAGIHSVVFGEGNQTIVAMKSVMGEEVPLDHTVPVNENVELWLGKLAVEMKGTLDSMLTKCLSLKDYREFPSQILCLADMVHFTQKAELSLQQGSLAAFRESLVAQLQEYTAFDVEGFKVMKLKIQSLVLDLIHNIDVVDQLIAEGASMTGDWCWHRQLRYYVQKGKAGSKVYMAEADMDYSFEYQGNAPKLVYTPLTDKCYLTLTQGMQLGYGGNPYGPAGTGKTESVKALGQCLARQVLVFNCDEEFDFKSMGRIFMGLIKCGAWGCFDEFNRLEEDVLSAVSQQIQTIQQALKEKSPKMDFMGRSVEVNHQACIFVTLNPAGKGYGGRSKLPDNLKQMFRSVAMTAPDNNLISEVLLLSEGFTDARTLGHKLVSLFNLSKQLLSPQQHYDWGLRALKTVLGIAGRQLSVARAEGEVPKELEAQIIIRSMRATTLPKMTFDDSSRFAGLLADIFPGVEVSDVVDKEIVDAIEAVFGEMGLELVPAQVQKVLQMHLACMQRIGVIVVGPSGSGKTTMWRVLEGAYRKLGRPVILHLMNPKAIHRKQLLGHMDMDTREWFDGVLTAAARQVVKEPIEQQSWIICDGDVDPEWIESLNSVLDDNKLLTMPSGERIQFGNNVNFIFECHDLKFASPATVSRTGMIFLSDENIDVSIMLKSWLAKQPEATRGRLEGYINEFFYRAFEMALAKPAVVETTKAGVLYGGLSHLSGLEELDKRSFCLALARGLGSNMDTETRGEFFSELARLTSESDLGQLPASFQAGQYGSGGEVAENGLVKVEEVNQALATIQPWLEHSEPFIMVGPEGCGKAVTLMHAFAEQKSTSVAVINCSAQTNASHAMQKLTQVCGQPVSTNEGRVLRPRDADKLILYFKDVNLPKPDKYDTIQLISFLQQLITFHGYYDEHLEFIRLEPKRVQIVCSMNPSTTVGRWQLTSRFTAIVRVVYVTYPERTQLQTVYYHMLKSVLDNHPSYGNESQLRKLAGSMLDIYEFLKQAFSPDDHGHYKFTPRHLSEWCLALQRYDLLAVDLMDVFGWEAARIFRDRLVGSEAEQRFDGLLSSTLRSQWRAGNPFNGIFTTWGVPADGGAVNNLAAMSTDTFHELVSQRMIQYEREVKDLNILLFPDVLQRLARMDRVLATDGGSMLLCGRSGVGRRSCLTLATYMHRMELVTPNMPRGYGIKQFRNDLKSVLTKCGVEGIGVVLLLEDHQFVVPAILEIVNSVLSGGEVPGLFTNEELEPMLAPLREEMATSGFQHKNLYSFFTARVKKNLHVVLSMDPSNPDFVMRCESNPALFTRCSIQWMEAWSKDALQAVPNMILKECFDASQDDNDEHVVEMMMAIQETCEATPRQYVAFVKMYGKIFQGMRASKLEQKQFLQAGLDKLGEAESKVDELSQQAGKQRALLAEKQAQAEQALTQITASMQRASESKMEVETLQKRLSEEEVGLNEKKGFIEKELAECQPLLESARKAVGSIKSDNINEIRSLKMPPDAIRDVLEGVLRLMGNADTSWMSMKKFLGSRAVKDEIINFDARKIDQKTRSAVQKLLDAKGASFEHANIYRVSVAAAPLAAWVKANVKYSLVLERIQPLENDLQVLVSSLDESKVRLVQCEDDLKTLDDEVTKLKDDFGGRTREAETLKIGLQSAEDQLSAAESLLGKLGGEKGRWDEQVSLLESEILELPLNALMSCGFIVYLPSATEQRRASIVDTWRKLTKVDGYNFRNFMSTESQMLTWKAEGLPSDDLSMENAIIILQTLQVPYIIDPSTQASDWLKGHMKQGGGTIEVTTTFDPKFVTTMELAVRFGKTLVIEEVDFIEPILYSLLRQDLLRQGPRLLVQIGEKQIDYNENFRLYLITRNPYPNVPPDAVSLIAETNFSVTHSGLEGQLLGLTIQQEQPELEQQKTTLLKQEEDLKVQLAELEKSLLQTLATSTGNILENHALIESLNETKVKSNTIKESLAESSQLQESLDKQRNVYRPIAERGSKMFFLMHDLRTLNHMYQFSLSVFIHIFKKALLTESPGVEVSARISMLASQLLQMVFLYTSRSLFKADRLTFGMHFCRYLQPDLFEGNTWDHFLGTLVDSMATGAGGGHQKPDWVPTEQQGSFIALSTALPSLMNDLDISNGDIWRQWLQNPNCETKFPEKVSGRVNSFHQLLVTQAFRPDRLESAMSTFICTLLGVKSVSPPPMSLARIHEVESSPSEPILFLTTPGADPSQELEEFADRTIGRLRYHQLAMGQGQAEVALALLKDCARTGDWLCLKNVHLVVSWLTTLEKEVYALSPHQDFRLFLTSEPHTKFPSSLLEGCLKITFESPPGMKKNMLRTYENWTPQYISQGNPGRAQLLFLLAWFHAVVQERRTYVPQGWSKFYEFSFADLRSGAGIIDLGTRDNKTPQWNYVIGLMQNAIYGGRVDNPFDVLTLRTYLEQFFNSEVTGAGGSRTKAIPGTKTIMLPSTAHHADYLSIVQSLPEMDDPLVFSMPANANRAVQEMNSARVLAQIKQMAASADAGAGFNREKWTRQLSPILKLWERLATKHPIIRQPFNPREVNVSTLKAPVNIFIAMDYMHGRNLMMMLERSLGALNRCLRGNEMLTPTITVHATSLLAGEIPVQWDSAWEGPEEPLQYLRSACARMEELEKLYGLVSRGQQLIGTVDQIDMGLLYHPETFLNALRQQTSREVNESMDSLQLVSTWETGYSPGHSMAIKVAGLVVQGAAFGGKRLEHMSTEAMAQQAVPPVNLAWIRKKQPLPYAASISIPCYRTFDRSRQLCELQMPLASGEDKAQWILSGVALFTSQ
ncbi:hypothetical protein CYMTET_8768 [Cymbomonas tetramitiformis]|uniref:Cytoplasmic dynein 2 heavy chain 1 n=1 Tax=Cymbomonas tetramitiformis TaxID=36881 RepID=A0AAE0GU89_9CHLO|nr:hypothetical protein CYMTET_8768 [Cymbomonas tetramitiformis]